MFVQGTFARVISKDILRALSAFGSFDNLMHIVS